MIYSAISWQKDELNLNQISIFTQSLRPKGCLIPVRQDWINVPDQYMLVRTFRSFCISSKARPVPKATQDSGSSAMDTGRPVA